LKTETDRSSLIGSALTVTNEPSKPIADTITAQNNLRLVPCRPTGSFRVLKVANRSLRCVERQAEGFRRSAALSGVGIGISQDEPPRFARLLRSKLGRLTANSERRTVKR
jgi:hypothetical protein